MEKIISKPCECANRFDLTIGDEYCYERVKRILNIGRHPTFIGRDTVCRNARNGGVLIFSYLGMDVGVLVVNAKTSVLLVACVVPSHRSHGLGSAMLAYAKPTWIRALESAVPFFCARGYMPIGSLKQGRSLRTQLMVRENLPSLAGRISRVFGDR